MTNDNLVQLKTLESTESFNDALSELVRQGARQIIAQAVETELQEFLVHYQDLKDDQGHQAIVRNGYLPQRTVMTGVGSVDIQVPKVTRPQWEWDQVQFNVVATVSQTLSKC
jgi:putative transposase